MSASPSVPSVPDMQCVWTEHVCSSLDLLCDNARLKAGGQRSSLAGAGDTTHPYKCTETSAVHSRWISGSHTNKQMSLFNLWGTPKVKCTFWNHTNVIILTREIKLRFNHYENDIIFIPKMCKYERGLLKLKRTDCLTSYICLKQRQQISKRSNK